MAKKPAAPPDPAAVAQQVTKALLTLAAGPARLTGKGEPAAVFTSATAAVKEAIAQLTAADAPLVEPVDATKGAPVRLTRAGFDAVLPYLPEDQVAPAAKAVVAQLGLDDRVALVRGVLSRTPAAAVELNAVLEEATAALAAETEAKVAAAKARRARAEIEEAAIARAAELLRGYQAARLDALRREYEAEGGRAADLPVATPSAEPAPRPVVTEPRREPLAPVTLEEKGFRREVIRRLAVQWREAVEDRRDEPARFLEAGIGNVRGVRQIGAAGESTRFDGEFHEADEGVSTGAPVRVERPGWVIDEDDDRQHVILKAKVSR